MILKRIGVFETNSSSCHSMALVGRLKKRTPKDATITDLYGELGYTPMFDNVMWTVKFENYCYIAQQLCNSQDKLWYLLTNIYSEYSYTSVFEDDFYKKIKQWLSNIGITLKEPEYEEYNDYVCEVLSQSVVSESMFDKPEDLYEYLFDNDLIIDIRSYEVNADY